MCSFAFLPLLEDAHSDLIATEKERTRLGSMSSDVTSLIAAAAAANFWAYSSTLFTSCRRVCPRRSVSLNGFGEGRLSARCAGENRGR